MADVTAEQAWSYRNRWALVRKLETAELQRTPIEVKQRQPAALCCGGYWAAGPIQASIDAGLTPGALGFADPAMANSQNHDLDALQVRSPWVENLLVVKGIGRRPKDIGDIRGPLAAHPEIVECAESGPVSVLPIKRMLRY